MRLENNVNFCMERKGLRNYTERSGHGWVAGHAKAIPKARTILGVPASGYNKNDPARGYNKSNPETSGLLCCMCVV